MRLSIRILLLSLITASLVLPQSPKARVEAELIQVIRGGFYPGSITRHAGRFLLIVLNTTDTPGLTLRLDRQDGSHIREVLMKDNYRDWSEAFDLAPGTYTLTEANHSSWHCLITISAL
jgi:hypothetical protein